MTLADKLMLGAFTALVLGSGAVVFGVLAILAMGTEASLVQVGITAAGVSSLVLSWALYYSAKEAAYQKEK